MQKVSAFQFHKRSTTNEFETFRKDYLMSLSDEEAHKKFDFYPVEEYILVRFANSKLVYVGVCLGARISLRSNKQFCQLA